MTKLVDHLQPDQNLKTLASTDESHLIVKRAMELDETVDVDEEIEEESPGFFERASKFVMELFRKFLKWINTDGN